MRTKRSYNVKLAFTLTDEERQVIREIVNKGKESARIIRRAQVLNLFDQGYTSPFIALAVSMNAVSVRDIGWRYLQGGFKRAIYEPSRPGHKRALTQRQEQRIIALACTKAPEGFARWTIELLVEHSIKRKIVQTVGRETIRLLLNSHDLKPWREKNVVYPGTDK